MRATEITLSRSRACRSHLHRCPACQFIFTTALDHFTNEDFLRFVYNEQYLLIDPDYQQKRPEGNAALCADYLRRSDPAAFSTTAGGNGVLAQLLRAAGFAQVVTFDPFVAPLTPPGQRVDSIALSALRCSSIPPTRRELWRTWSAF